MPLKLGFPEMPYLMSQIVICDVTAICTSRIFYRENWFLATSVFYFQATKRLQSKWIRISILNMILISAENLTMWNLSIIIFTNPLRIWLIYQAYYCWGMVDDCLWCLSFSSIMNVWRTRDDLQVSAHNGYHDIYLKICTAARNLYSRVFQCFCLETGNIISFERQYRFKHKASVIFVVSNYFISTRGFWIGTE